MCKIGWQVKSYHTKIHPPSDLQWPILRPRDLYSLIYLWNMKSIRIYDWFKGRSLVTYTSAACGFFTLYRGRLRNLVRRPRLLVKIVILAWILRITGWRWLHKKNYWSRPLGFMQPFFPRQTMGFHHSLMRFQIKTYQGKLVLRNHNELGGFFLKIGRKVLSNIKIDSWSNAEFIMKLYFQKHLKEKQKCWKISCYRILTLLIVH